ncbi:unnamed protein product [Didymodactylos carnosus]|uniref:Uncharacterized protein n=1 Tax=Didymodactylos carnosus TaxID=1234261 RepID=A0A814MKH3_9BILA|nr:unnamed protein product [Didymodactylos carnosus]CAF1079927.1 unnamed protein product [Didymodactylos carnosus]CAF3670431.1 unnamed protein product [Didymodactylos carnosus]CAF3845968.1 unnamed protein product [Didymodactylos carnosus]
MIHKRDVLKTKILGKMQTTAIQCISAPELDATMLEIFPDKSFTVRIDKTLKALQQHTSNIFAPLTMMWAKIQSGLKSKKRLRPKKLRKYVEQAIITLGQATAHFLKERRSMFLSKLIPNEAQAKEDCE